MSRDAADIRRSWAALRERGETGSGDLVAALDADVDTGHGSVKLAVEKAKGVQVYFPVAPGTKRPSIGDFAAIEVSLGILAGGSGSKSYIILTCLNPNLEGAFADFVEAVLLRIEAGNPTLEAIVAAITELRALFEQITEDVVDEKTMRGLLAELIVLLRLTQRHPKAVELWFGPHKDRHDFRGGQRAIEVKSSLRETGSVTISALEQLAPPVDGSLQLWRAVLERSSGGLLTIGSLSTQIETLCSEPALFRSRLKQMGCSDPQSSTWNQSSFNLEGLDAWAIAEGFPKIVPATFGTAGVPAGVVKVVYELDLSQAKDFRLTKDQMEAAEMEILHCLG